MAKKKVLGIVSSYRKTGNSEIVVKAVYDKMRDDWDLSLIRLPKLKIFPCKGCYACLIPGKQCNLKDDMQWFIDQLRASDAVIFSAPNYVMAPVGIVKLVADRAIQTAAYYNELKKIKAVVALTLGKEDYRGYADTALASQVGALGIDVVCLKNFYGTHPGEAALADVFEKDTQEMADSLIVEDYEKEPEPNRCPRCFSDLFRIHAEGLECSVCKSLARLDGGKLDFFFHHPEFTDEGRIEHMKWLLMKKEEYPGLKDKLKRIQDQYKWGDWAAPEGND